MPSEYTVNLGIEKIATGEQSGTWGDTTNTNWNIIDKAVNGLVSVNLPAVGSSGTPNDVAISDGAVSDGQNKYIEFTDSGDLGSTAFVRITPSDAEKIVHIRNSLSGSRAILIFQGTYNAANDFSIAAGADVLLKFNGGGVGATVTDVFVNLTATAMTAASITASTYSGLPVASNVLAGISELATVAETNTGTDATRAVTPAAIEGWTGSTAVTTLGTITSGTWSGTAITTLGTVTAGVWQGTAINQTYLVGQSGINTGETVSGIIEIATQVEVDAGTDALRAITPATLSSYPFSVAAASETVAGSVELATLTEVNTGTDTTRVITPYTLANHAYPSSPAASETVAGILELATQVEVDAGTDTSRAITPATLSNYSFPAASETVSGILELATQVEADAGSDALRAITPATLSNYPFPQGIPLDTVVKTAGLTAVAGNHYVCNTTAGGFTVTLPNTPSAGDAVKITDYIGTFATNNLIVDRNAEDINNIAADMALDVAWASVEFLYIDTTVGWRAI